MQKINIWSRAQALLHARGARGVFFLPRNFQSVIHKLANAEMHPLLQHYKGLAGNLSGGKLPESEAPAAGRIQGSISTPAALDTSSRHSPTLREKLTLLELLKIVIVDARQIAKGRKLE